MSRIVQLTGLVSFCCADKFSRRLKFDGHLTSQPLDGQQPSFKCRLVHFYGDKCLPCETLEQTRF